MSIGNGFLSFRWQEVRRGLDSGSRTKTRFEVSFWPAVERAALLPSAVKQRINQRSGLEFDRCDCERCHAMSDYEEDPYAGEGGDAGYVSFEQWTRRYVNGGPESGAAATVSNFVHAASASAAITTIRS